MRDIRDLAAALRDKSKWPVGFRWNYENCHSCAMGFACDLYPEYGGSDTANSSRMVKLFGGDEEALHEIFIGDWKDADGEDIRYIDVTPEMVADRIDQYIKEGRL
jgi:hypothetical protein